MYIHHVIHVMSFVVWIICYSVTIRGSSELLFYKVTCLMFIPSGLSCQWFESTEKEWSCEEWCVRWWWLWSFPAWLTLLAVTLPLGLPPATLKPTIWPTCPYMGLKRWCSMGRQRYNLKKKIVNI
jgi:hypothetical protein